MRKCRSSARCSGCRNVVRGDRIQKHFNSFPRCHNSTSIPLHKCRVCNTMHELAAVRGDNSFCPPVIREESTSVVVNTVADGLAKLKRSVVERRSVDARASSNDNECGGWDNDINEPNFVEDDDVWKVLQSNEDESVGEEEPDDTFFVPCFGENVPILMEQDQNQQEVPKLCRHVGLNGKDYLHDSAKNDSRGYIPDASKSIPLPAEMKLPACHKIGMHPLELELMLFIHDNNLPPSLYDGIIKWAKKANESGYDFGSRTHQSLKKQLDSVLPPSLHGGSLLSRVFKGSRPDEAPVKLWYFDPLTLIARAMRDPVIMKHFICYPQTKRTACGVRIFDEFVSADAFHNAFKNSPASTDDGKHLRPGCLFVSVGEFDNSSCTSALMKKSEHPYLLTMMNLSLEARKSVESWFLVSFLPDVEVSDLEKSEKNQKANGDLALRR